MSIIKKTHIYDYVLEMTSASHFLTCVCNERCIKVDILNGPANDVHLSRATNNNVNHFWYIIHASNFLYNNDVIKIHANESNCANIRIGSLINNWILLKNQHLLLYYKYRDNCVDSRETVNRLISPTANNMYSGQQKVIIYLIFKMYTFNLSLKMYIISLKMNRDWRCQHISLTIGETEFQ